MNGQGAAIVIRGDARHLPLPDASVDLIVTSPPYFGLRSYKDGDEHYDGQIGSEPSPAEFLEALWEVTAECWRVLKPTGSMFVNLGDKRAGVGAPGTTSGLSGRRVTGTPVGLPGGPVQGERSGKRSYNHDRDAEFGRAKSKMLLPHRYAIGCEDGRADPEGLGWVVRQDMVWSKPNGLPESVTDRTRDAHEYWFHLCREGSYFSAIDEIREPYAPKSLDRIAAGFNGNSDRDDAQLTKGYESEATYEPNALGKLPDSVWSIPTEPLKVPDWLDVEHFAAFPTEWPRRLISGWSPSGVCTRCGEGRRPVVEKELADVWHDAEPQNTRYDGHEDAHQNNRKSTDDVMMRTFGSTRAQIIGEACACTPYTDYPERRRPTTTPGRERRNDDDARAAMNGGSRHHGNDWPERQPVREYDLTVPLPPTRPAVVLDPFGGTGTTALVARALGRIGVSVDLSADYCRLARWRIFQSGHAAKIVGRTMRERQGTLL